MSGHTSRDPLGHVKLAVSDLSKSKLFYARLFSRLDLKQVADKEKSAAWVTTEGFGISIAQADIIMPRYKFSAPGLHHLCIKARSKKEVDEVYDLMKDETHIFDPPKRYPEYTQQYYAVFFADPDGMKLEVAYY